MRAAYVVGCDGAHSAVRHALTLPFEGTPYEEKFVLADVHIDWSLPDDETHVFFSPEGVIAALPVPGDCLWRLIAEASVPQPSLDDFVRLLHERGAPRARLDDAKWMAAFRIHRRIAPRYRLGRVFLAGDAAHIHSPVGGQGMNTGLQDAFNLAWKLELVHKGACPPALLDSYESERRLVAAATLQGTDLATRMVTLRNPIGRVVRNRLGAFLSTLEVLQKRVVARASQTAVAYRRSPIVAEHREPLARATVARRAGEGPTIADWMDFGEAPHAGDHAVQVSDDDDGGLFRLFRHSGHTLLLFDGAAATAEGYANLLGVAHRARERCGVHIETWIVVPLGEKPKELAIQGNVLLDASGSIHRRYGAGSECLYLVRPDGYVGFRSQPASWPALERHFASILGW